MNTNHFRSLLHNAALFHGLDADVYEQLLQVADIQMYRKGAVLFEEGDPLESIYLLAEGQVQCYSERSGKRFVFMTYEAGETIGEVSYMDGGPCAWGAVAESDCQFMVFKVTDLRRILQSVDSHTTEEIHHNALDRMARIVRKISTSAKNLALLDVYGRVRILFNESMIEEHGVVKLKRSFTQQEIADQIGSSREMVARILKELAFGHYIKLENKKIVLLKMLPENF